MVSVDVFIKAVLRSGLLGSALLDDSLRSIPPDKREDAEFVADSLVRQGKLSRFQAEKLLEGAPLGLVLGPYHVLAPIGKGGMGTVYLARDSRTRKLLALKILPPKRAREEERMLARFRREMELCQRVSHTHLTQTYEAGVHQGVYFIAMEFLPGKSLYRLVTESGPLTVPHAARLFAEVALALDHAHRRGLIHRDMKPSNIMVTPNDHVKVLDLGLAMIQGETSTDREILGGQGYVVGTMDYLAPEQADDSTKVDPRTDIYSLGCTLYFALTGRPPFPGGGKLEKIEAHRTRQPEPLGSRVPGIPPAFAALVEKMLAKQPSQRHQSAMELFTELRRWFGEAPALPLDAANDSSFKQAVLKLEQSPPPAELARESIPVLGAFDFRPADNSSRPAGPAIQPRIAWQAQLLAMSVQLHRHRWLMIGVLVLLVLAGGVLFTVVLYLVVGN
jgi:serine/threonine protein kinase